LAKLKYINNSFFIILFHLGFSQFVDAQTIQDQCFYSVDIGLDFNSSESIVNSNENGADMIKFNNGSWEGMGNNAASYNISINPPVNCQHAKAIFFPLTQSNESKAVGFQLVNPLVAGQFYSFIFTYVSHGFGSDPSFSPDIYTNNSNQFYDGLNIDALFVNDLNDAGANWTTQNFNFVATPAQNEHNWLFVNANEGSGMIFNFCQISDGIIPPFELEQEDILCEGSSIALEIPVNAEYYNWSTGEPSQIIEISFSGTYVAFAGNDCNSQQASITIEMSEMPELNITQDTVLCEGVIFPLTAEGTNAEYFWQDGSDDMVFEISEPGTYQLRIIDDCFDITDSVTVSYDSIPRVDLGLDTTLCFGQSYFIDATYIQDNISYSWNDGLDSPDRTINEAGYYRVTLSNQCGSASDDVRVVYSIAPPDIFPGIVGYCAFRELELSPDLDGFYEWQDGSTGSSYTVSQTGFYYVTIVDDDDCFTISDTVEVVEERCLCPVYVPNSFSPNDDGKNDVFGSYHDCDPYEYYLEIFDRGGRIIYSSDVPKNGWDGKSGPTFAPVGMYVYRISYAETHDSLLIEKTGAFTLVR